MGQQTLIKKIKKGDQEVFADFFRSNYASYVAFAMRYLKSRSDASDIVQNAFIKLWEKRKDLDPEKSLTSFMYTVIRNSCLNFIRDHKQRHVELEEKVLTIHQPPAVFRQPEISPGEIINALIEQLPERQREAFELSRIDGLQHDEIAEIMDVSPRTVNNHMVAALKTLRALYDKHRKELLAI